MADELEVLCERKKNRAIRFKIATCEEDIFAQRAVGSCPDTIEVTLTDSTRLQGFGVAIQGYIGLDMEPFSTSYVIERNGSIRWASTVQTPTKELPEPRREEDVMTYRDKDPSVWTNYEAMLGALMAALSTRAERVTRPFGRG